MLSKLSLILLACVLAFSSAFVAPHHKHVIAPSETALYGLFDGLAGAFANDESLGARENAGLKNGPNFNEDVTVNGKPVKGAVVGQKLTAVANKARVKIPVNCQKGDCGTCMVKFNGRQVKACQTPLPAGKAAIQTL